MGGRLDKGNVLVGNADSGKSIAEHQDGEKGRHVTVVIGGPFSVNSLIWLST